MPWRSSDSTIGAFTRLRICAQITMDWAAAVLAPVPTLRQRGYGMKHNALLQHAGIVGGSLVPSCNPSGCYNKQQDSYCWLGRLVSFIILLCCCFVWRRLDSHIRGLRIICSTSLPDFEIRSGEMRSGSAFSPDQKSKPTNLGLNWESEKSKNKNWWRCVHKLSDSDAPGASGPNWQ